MLSKSSAKVPRILPYQHTRHVTGLKMQALNAIDQFPVKLITHNRT
jgi:hypothetical protein